MSGRFGDRQTVQGTAAPGFQHVREEFQRNFSERGEYGAACAIFHRGVKVVDLWGGYHCRKTRQPWTEQTLALSFSVTKGMSAAALAVAHSQGLFELDEKVATYWPEFAQLGKQDISVRQLLTHQAGLVCVDTPLDAERLADLDAMAEILARQKPAWRPGARHGYHTLTLGWYQSELIRRIDPRSRSLGHFFDEEVAQPLGVEFYIGLPARIGDDRVATTEGFHRISILRHLDDLPVGMVLAGIWPRSLVAKSVRSLPIENPADIGGPQYRGVEIPSANGIGQARAVAQIYGVLACGGRELGLRPQTLRELTAPASAPTQGVRDVILKMDTHYGFGFSRPSQSMPFGSTSRAFGCPGAGGSFAMADPDQQLSFAYITNKMGYRVFDDAREKAVRDACYRCLGDHGQSRRVA